MNSISTIYIHTRPQVDTVIAVYLLKNFGEEHFPGIKDANIEILSVPEKSEEEYEAQGAVLVDIGGGKFDHHGKDTTATSLISEFLGKDDYSPLQKLIELAERDDKYGKGIVSKDRLDRAFGFPGLLMSLNKSFPKDPGYVISTFLPIIDGHVKEEKRRTIDLPQEYEDLESQGLVHQEKVNTSSGSLKFIALKSDNTGMPGWVRAVKRADVIMQITSDGHVAILTSKKRFDLDTLAYAIRSAELSSKGEDGFLPPQVLSEQGRLEIVPEWYYDKKTRVILNGGIHAPDVTPTSIGWDKLIDVVSTALSHL